MFFQSSKLAEASSLPCRMHTWQALPTFSSNNQLVWLLCKKSISKEWLVGETVLIYLLRVRVLPRLQILPILLDQLINSLKQTQIMMEKLSLAILKSVSITYRGKMKRLPMWIQSRIRLSAWRLVTLLLTLRPWLFCLSLNLNKMIKSWNIGKSLRYLSRANWRRCPPSSWNCRIVSLYNFLKRKLSWLLMMKTNFLPTVKWSIAISKMQCFFLRITIINQTRNLSWRTGPIPARWNRM